MDKGLIVAARFFTVGVLVVGLTLGVFLGVSSTPAPESQWVHDADKAFFSSQGTDAGMFGSMWNKLKDEFKRDSESLPGTDIPFIPVST